MVALLRSLNYPESHQELTFPPPTAFALACTYNVKTTLKVHYNSCNYINAAVA